MTANIINYTAVSLGILFISSEYSTLNAANVDVYHIEVDYAPNHSGCKSSGAAFLIDKTQNLLVTSKHLFEQPDECPLHAALDHPIITARLNSKNNADGFILDIQDLKADASFESDIAIIQSKNALKGMQHKFCTNFSPAEDNDILLTAWGFPLNDPLSSTQVHYLSQVNFLWRVESDFSPGYSGGPVIDNNGYVVGIVKGGNISSSQVKRVVPLSFLKNILISVMNFESENCKIREKSTFLFKKLGPDSQNLLDQAVSEINQELASLKGGELLKIKVESDDEPGKIYKDFDDAWKSHDLVPVVVGSFATNNLFGDYFQFQGNVFFGHPRVANLFKSFRDWKSASGYRIYFKHIDKSFKISSKNYKPAEINYLLKESFFKFAVSFGMYLNYLNLDKTHILKNNPDTSVELQVFLSERLYYSANELIKIKRDIEPNDFSKHFFHTVENVIKALVDGS